MIQGQPTIEPARGRSGWGVVASLGGFMLRQPRPVAYEIRAVKLVRRACGYTEVEPLPSGFLGRARLGLLGTANLEVCDIWQTSADGIAATREFRVMGTAQGASFLTSLRVAIAGVTWLAVEPFVPGLTYGNCEEVPPRSVGSLQSRRRGVRWIVAREDRMAAPVFSIRLGDGRWLSVRHVDATAETAAVDGADIHGGLLVDGALRTASLGGVSNSRGLEIGLWMPGSEGEVTYESGGLPQRQRRGWRHRHLPVVEGVAGHFKIELTSGHAADPVEHWSEVWHDAWQALEPEVTELNEGDVLADAVRVLASQVRWGPGVAGIPLEADPTTGSPLEPLRPAIMGFVGANTDAAELLIRLGAGAGIPGAASAGVEILDTFAGLRLQPPAGEGFNLVSGRVTTYRQLAGRRAVFARSIAEGAYAALRAAALPGVDASRGSEWRAWALAGGAWLLGSQGVDGGIPRAWVAGSGELLQASTNATATAIPFLVALGLATGESRWLDAAVHAGEHVWHLAGGRNGCFAGATLDNPNVVDKEASVLALEGFLALLRATGERVWLDRALAAAKVAETWTYIWNVPVPLDGDVASLGWKPGVPNVGLQLITSGVSMADGFLAANAAAFARLGELTGDTHWLDVARVVTWGPKAMLAVAGRTFDLAGPGWTQEHWSLATNRGRGLNRNWLPWVAVATVRGLLRLRDETPCSADLISGRAAHGEPRGGRHELV